jgi:L-2,4-diaminobutyrate decarboxylase
MFETDFFSNRPESMEAYRAAVAVLVEALATSLPDGAFAGGSPAELAARLPASPSTSSQSMTAALDRLSRVVGGSVATYHPRAAAHLHCPVLIPALMAEMALTALNQSMDSFDQAPAATLVEQQMVEWACRLVGLPAAAEGVFTAGGTQSNYMGLLLARDRLLTEKWGWPVRERGLPPESARLKILCSEAAHFSVAKSAHQLGLGTDAVIPVVADEAGRLRPDALTLALLKLRLWNQEPMAIVATAGTTDFGSFDPLERIAGIATEAGAWLHVDAAYGGALLLSRQHRHKLAGIERADSVTIDFHKAFYQPISCSAFLVSNGRDFDFIRHHAAYLNPDEHEQQGIPDLVTRSVLTSRRFDALKVWMTLQTTGQERLAAMVERTVDLARATAEKIAAHPRLELIHQPEFGCILFRYRPEDYAADSEAIQRELPLRLLEQGAAVIGYTVWRGRRTLKLTALNPCSSENDLEELLELIVSQGRSIELELGELSTGGQKRMNDAVAS